MIGFFIGLLIGGTVGIFVAGLCAAVAPEYDDVVERDDIGDDSPF